MCLFLLILLQILYEQRISSLKDQLEHLSGPSPLQPPTAAPGDHQVKGVQSRVRKGRGEEEEEKPESQSDEKVGSVSPHPTVLTCCSILVICIH